MPRKPKPGRPPLPASKKRGAPMAIRLNADEERVLASLVKRHNTTRTGAIRLLIEREGRRAG